MIRKSTHPFLWRRLEEGARAFDGRRFWAAHEAWEDGWRSYQGPDRNFLKGLIQLAAAGYHLQRGRRGPAMAVLERAPQHLATDPSQWPFDCGHLLAVCAALSQGCRRPQLPAPPRLRLSPMLAAAEWW